MNLYNIISSIISGLLIILVLGLLIINLPNESKNNNFIDDKVQVSKYVRVDKSIIEGYEGEDYIPRCAAINKRLRGVNK